MFPCAFAILRDARGWPANRERRPECCRAESETPAADWGSGSGRRRRAAFRRAKRFDLPRRSRRPNRRAPAAPPELLSPQSARAAARSARIGGYRRGPARHGAGWSCAQADILRARAAGPARVDANSPFFFQAEDGIRDLYVTGVQTCALPI